MANLTVTNNDLGTVIIADALFDDNIIQFPGADTYVEGTIMARKQVADAIVAAADGGNTGTGTVTLASVIAGDVIPLVGAYVFENTAVVAEGGVFKLVDPNGVTVEENITLRVGAGLVTVITAGGMTFTVTEGGTDFDLADFFTLTVAVDGDVVIFAEDGVGGAQIPSMVLTYEVVATGAADIASRLMVSGRVRREKLVIDAGGTVTDRIVDALRDFGIVAQPVDELNILDNQ